MGRVEPLEQAEQLAHQGAAILEQVVPNRGGIQAALRIDNVQAKDLIKADGDLVVGLGEGGGAGSGKLPGPEETRAGTDADGVVVDLLRQGGLVPAAGVQVNVVPVRHQTSASPAMYVSHPPRVGNTLS